MGCYYLGSQEEADEKNKEIIDSSLTPTLAFSGMRVKEHSKTVPSLRQILLSVLSDMLKAVFALTEVLHSQHPLRSQGS